MKAVSVGGGHPPPPGKPWAERLRELLRAESLLLLDIRYIRYAIAKLEGKDPTTPGLLDGEIPGMLQGIAESRSMRSEHKATLYELAEKVRNG